MSPGDVLIVGAGIGGLTAALALADEGRPVHVLESAPRLGEIGAGIQLGPNATRVLSSLGLLDDVAATAVRPRQLVYMDAMTGEPISALDCDDAIVARYGFPYLVVHRSDLHSALLERCAASAHITVTTGLHVTSIAQDADTVTAICSDGTSHEGSALIGADGLHSVARKFLSDDEPVPSSYVAYRGAIPFSDVSPHAGADSMVMWVGDGLHLVQYKLRGGELYNQVGVFRSDRLVRDEHWGSPEELDARFAPCCDAVRHAASLLDRDARWPMFDREPIPNWTAGRVTLLGDAAHPMLQYLAQGGCQALEDALVLRNSIDKHDGYEAAFADYQAQRIPRTARVQVNARRFGDASHLGGVAAEIRNALFGQHQSNDYAPFDWLYEDVA